MDFPLTLRFKWMLQNLPHPLLRSNIILLYALLNYGTIIIPKEWNNFFPNKLVFRIDCYPYRVRVRVFACLNPQLVL